MNSHIYSSRDIHKATRGLYYSLRALMQPKDIKACSSPSLPPLSDFENYPKGSFGKAYFDHLTKNKLTNYTPHLNEESSDETYLRERKREIHDIIHTLLGRSISIKEEACVNAFMMAHTGVPISTVIVSGTILSTLLREPEKLNEMISEIIWGWNQGQKARSVFGYHWEEKFKEPLEQVRAEIFGEMPKTLC